MRSIRGLNHSCTSDVARLNFSVSRLLAPAPLRQPSDSTPPSKPYTAVAARPLLCLKCDECGKLRRVDHDSFLLFSPLVWEEDALRSAEAELLGSATTVRDFLHSCEATDTVLDVPAVNPALASCLNSMQRCAFLTKLFDVVGLQRCSDCLRALYDEVLTCLSRPRFTCAMLVDTTCLLDDDLHSIATPKDSLLHLQPSSGEPVLVFVPSRALVMPYAATFRKATRCKPLRRVFSGTECSVDGCRRSFHDSSPRTATLRFRNRIVARVEALCNMHYLRLSRSRTQTAATWMQALWTRAELLEDASRTCTLKQDAPSVSHAACTGNAVSLVLRFRDPMAAPPGQDVTYVSNDIDLWTNLQPTSATVSLSPARLCLEFYAPAAMRQDSHLFQERPSATHLCCP